MSFSEASIPEIEEKKAIFGGKVTFRFDGRDFTSKTEAEAARLAQVEEGRRLFEAQQRMDMLVQDYEAHPEYVVESVRCRYIADTKDGFFGPKETGLGAFVDLDDLRQKVHAACRSLHIRGYEVIAINEATSGVGSYKLNNTAGAGWGFSFTHGAIITGQRRKA